MLLGLMECLFICASLFALRGFYPFAFPVLWWFPHLWQQQNPSTDQSPSPNCIWERKSSTSTLPGWGEPGVPAGAITGIAELMLRRFSARCPKLRGSGQLGVPAVGWAGLDQPCVYSQLWINLSSSMFLLIPAGSHCFSNTCFLFFFSPSTPSSCVI